MDTAFGRSPWGIPPQLLQLLGQQTVDRLWTCSRLSIRKLGGKKQPATVNHLISFRLVFASPLLPSCPTYSPRIGVVSHYRSSTNTLFLFVGSGRTSTIPISRRRNRRGCRVFCSASFGLLYFLAPSFLLYLYFYLCLFWFILLYFFCWKQHYILLVVCTSYPSSTTV